jgi:hypothetical protein
MDGGRDVLMTMDALVPMDVVRGCARTAGVVRVVGA